MSNRLAWSVYGKLLSLNATFHAVDEVEWMLLSSRSRLLVGHHRSLAALDLTSRTRISVHDAIWLASHGPLRLLAQTSDLCTEIVGNSTINEDVVFTFALV